MTGFYKYDADYVSKYLEIMEDLKYTPDSISFDTIFRRVYSIKGRNEISFASKMLHTFNPDCPIWDTQVTKRHFNLSRPYPGVKDSFTAYSKKYDRYLSLFNEYKETENAKDVIKAFDERFSGVEISDTKKIDFIMWQDR